MRRGKPVLLPNWWSAPSPESASAPGPESESRKTKRKTRTLIVGAGRGACAGLPEQDAAHTAQQASGALRGRWRQLWLACGGVRSTVGRCGGRRQSAERAARITAGPGAPGPRDGCRAHQDTAAELLPSTLRKATILSHHTDRKPALKEGCYARPFFW